MKATTHLTAMQSMNSIAPLKTAASIHSTEPHTSDLPLSADEEIRLCILARQGDPSARERLILMNLRMVNAIARTFEGRGLHFEDLVAEGTIGLIRAVDHHDLGHRTRLTTYAAVLVKQQIIHALNFQSRIVRLPGNVLEKLRLLERITTMETAATGRPPTDEELAELTGTGRGKIAELKGHNRSVVSMDQAFDDGDGGSLHDTVDDPVANSPHEAVASADIIATVHGLLEKLEIRERRILLARFGFHDGREKTLDELSRLFCVTRERIRQIQNIALRKLRLAMAN